MAASFTTFCASWRPKASRKPRALLAGTSAGLALALAACAPDKEGNDHSAPIAFPFGPELARAQGAEIDLIKTPGDEVTDLSPDQLAALLEAGKVRLIDVRTKAEVAQGIIKGAEHRPLSTLDAEKLASEASDQPIVFYCRSGRRSAEAARALAAITGQSTAHLAGGILAWSAAGRKVS